MRVAHWIVALAGLAAGPVQAAPKPPKLVVVISVDQFSSDLFAEWRGKFSGGLKRMASGVVFPAGYQSHAATETCPGHATITSGIHPGRAGIAANDWFGMRGKSSTKSIAWKMKTSPAAAMMIIPYRSSI